MNCFLIKLSYFTYSRFCKRNQKLRDNEWITSGSLGSRDAVLVFRTSVLSTKPKISGTSLQTANCETTEKVNNSSNNVQNFSVKNIGPSTSKSIHYTSKTLKSELDNERKYLARLPKNVIRIVSSEKNLCDSLSSSENSISSEGDEPDEIENQVASVSETGVDSIEDTNIVGAVEDDENDNKIEGLIDDYTPAIGMPAVDLRLTYKFIQTETKLLRKIFARHGLSEAEENENFSILWTGIHMKPDILRNLAPYQRVNHFPRYVDDYAVSK